MLDTRPDYIHDNGRVCEWDRHDRRRYLRGTAVPCDWIHP